MCKHYLYCFVVKVKNHMTVPFLRCRKHTIWHVPRFWHLPGCVGNAYDSPYFGTKLVLKNCVISGVTEATLWWWFGNQQSLIVSRFMRCHNCGGHLVHFKSNGSVCPMLEQSCFQFFSGEQVHQNNWVIEIQFIFGSLHDFV